MQLKFDQAALKALDNDPDVVRSVSDMGDTIADRANARAEALFTDQGGGGVGSIESHIEHDEQGTYARIAYPPEHAYMWLHEVGSEHEKPRPHVRPALYGTKDSAAGGKSAGIKRVTQSKSATATTKKNRAAATPPRTVKRSK
jgi:hypothetical protein